MHHLLKIILFVAGLGCAAAVRHHRIKTPSPCPEHWILGKEGGKCYVALPLIKLDSWAEQAAFCANMGAKVIEAHNVAEVHDIHAIAKTFAGQWTDGPWVNYIAAFDNQILSASTLTPPQDPEVKKFLQGKFKDGGSAKKRCIGFSADGVTFNFAECDSACNPMCQN